MTDLWYTFGALVADPLLFKMIADPKPKVTPIKMFVSIEADQPKQRRAAVFLDDEATTNLRRGIRNYLCTNFPKPAPVISLYTAAKLCQLLNTHPGFADVFRMATAAFVKVGGAKTNSNEMLTLMGLSLLDPRLVTALAGGDGPLPFDTMTLSQEFGLHPAGTEYATLKKWIREKGFNDAQALLMTADCWTDAPCSEDFVFYPDFEGAVN